MFNLLGVVVLGALLITGCQPKESSNDTSAKADVATQRKEAARQLIAQSITMLSQKDFAGAVKSLDAAIKFDPTNQEAYFILGQLLLKSGENERAAQFLDAAVKNFPENATLYNMLGIANQLNGKKLPAVLAIRRSYELFKAAGDQESAEQAAIMLQQIITEAEEESATKDETNSKK